MTAEHTNSPSGAEGLESAESAHHSAAAEPKGLSILLYSDDVTTRDKVRLAVGRRPARDVAVESWHEVATPQMVLQAAESGAFDLLILDGEAAKLGGMGLARQLKHEVFDCPPVVVLTGRPEDAWLAAWSMADLAVPQPLDPIVLAAGVAELARRTAGERAQA